MSDENDCRHAVQREENWIHTWPTWSIAVRERLLAIFCDYLDLMLQYALGIGYDSGS